MTLDQNIETLHLQAKVLRWREVSHDAWANTKVQCQTGGYHGLDGGQGSKGSRDQHMLGSDKLLWVAGFWNCSYPSKNKSLSYS